MKKIIIVVAVIFLSIFFLVRENEYKKIKSPDGRYSIVVSYRLYNNLFPLVKGNSGDKLGVATMYDTEGHNLGSLALPRLSFASDIEWQKDKATIQFLGEWNFSNKMILDWSNGQTKLFVKTMK